MTHQQMATKNKFSRILHHINSKEINEKIELLNEIPTNNTAGIYVVEPERTEIINTTENLEPDLIKDDQENGRDTTGLFAPDGTILTDIPPGDNSYILGPMMLIRYTYPTISYELGYIGQTNRRFTALGRITGAGSNFSGWDGETGFTSYGQLSLEQAQWFRERFLENQVAQYRVFVNGPPPYFPYIAPGPDVFGRFLGWIIGIGRQIGNFFRNRIAPTMGGFDPNLPPGSANPNIKRNPNTKRKLSPEDYAAYIAGGGNEAARRGEPIDDIINQGRINLNQPPNPNNPEQPPVPIGSREPTFRPGDQSNRTHTKGETTRGLDVKTLYHGTSKSSADGIQQGGFNPTKTGLIPNRVWVGDKNVANDYAKGGRSSGSMNRNAPENRSVIPVRIPKNSGISFPGPFGKEVAISKNVGDRGARFYDSSGRPVRSNVASNTRRTSTPRRAPAGTRTKLPGGSSHLGGTGTASGTGRYTPGRGGRYGLAGIGLADSYSKYERRKKILKEIKKPYILPEEPKLKFKHKPKVRSVGENMMKNVEVPQEFKPQPNVWRKGELQKNEILSQQRKNDVLEMTGNSDWFWEYMTETSREKNKNIQYTNFEDKSEKIKGKVIRKEELKGDYLVFIQDQKTNHKKTILQSELNELLAQENAPKEFQQFFEQETLQADKDPLFKRVSKRLKKEIDYPDKPAKNGYPNDPPPKMINGWHPEYGKGKGYYNKLDPHSAESMPNTGNSEIDKKVVKARKQPK